MNADERGASSGLAPPLTYHVTALQITIYFNREGDHDHDGLIFALTENVPLLKYIRALAKVGSTPGPGGATPGDSPDAWYAAASARAALLQVELPATPEDARRPHPLVRPLVRRFGFSNEKGRAWFRHNVEEVGMFENFLPELYHTETGRRE